MGDCKTPYIYSEFSFLGRSYRSFATPSRVLKSRIFQDPRGTKKTYIGNTHTHTKKKLKLPNTIPPAIVFLLRIVYQNLQVLFLVTSSTSWSFQICSRSSQLHGGHQLTRGEEFFQPGICRVFFHWIDLYQPLQFYTYKNGGAQLTTWSIGRGIKFYTASFFLIQSPVFLA